jgi:GntR family transcriptional regulator/MocR family aminotransferase
MRRTTTPLGAILLVGIDRTRPTLLSQQIYESVQRAVESGQLPTGSVLPSSRALAADLRVSRSTVTLAYEHLRREGYIANTPGRVHRVADGAVPPPVVIRAAGAVPASPPVSVRSRRLKGLPPDLEGILMKKPRAFRPGIPALDVFPVDVWQRLRARVWRRTTPQSLAYGDVLGHPPLRRALAAHRRAARGLTCTADDIVICNGTQQALDFAARLLADEGDRAWVEDPGHPGARLAFEANGIEVVPVPVDGEGLVVEAGIDVAPEARLAYVTPARQFPVGVTMSERRRQALMAWADAARAWIFEDEYDSELRYASRPQAPLQATDVGHRVVLAGSFSKILMPSLRLGYMVVPQALIEPLRRLRMASDLGNPVLPQAVLADFIDDGHFARHIRRMRTLYQERHDLLVALLRERLAGLVDAPPTGAGLTLPVWLGEGISEREVAALAPSYGLDVSAMGSASIAHPHREGLLLGFASLADREIREGVERLERLLANLARS